MSANKRYYYLKLKDDFFDTDEIKILESMPDGFLYSNILLKMYCRSLRYDGRLMFNDTIPYNSQIIATLTNHPIGVVEKAIKVFKQLNLIEILDNGAVYMLQIQNFIGKSTTEADRIRDYRERISKEKSLPCTNVQKMYDKCTPEIEIEREIYIETRDRDIYCEAEKSKGNKKTKSEAYLEEFETFWEKYPHRQDRGSKQQTQKNWNNQIKHGRQPQELIAAAENYAEYCAASSTDFIYKASNFLGEKNYVESFFIKPEGGYARAVTKPDFKQRLGDAKERVRAKHFG